MVADELPHFEVFAVVLQTKAPVLNVSRKGQTFEVSRGAVDSGGKNVVQAGSVLLATGSASQVGLSLRCHRKLVSRMYSLHLRVIH